MHPNNIHKEKYNLDDLTSVYPNLKNYIFTNKYNTQTIDFSNANAVKALNTALLKKHYGINYWDFPEENLCPAIPSRADYIHYLADLLPKKQDNIKVLDIGTGASCVYPLLGNSIYKWQFIGTDIDSKSIDNALHIIQNNHLEDVVQIRLQKNKNEILKGVINQGDYFHISMCNPPFYKSKEDAVKANLRKVENLNLKTKSRNFSGNANELWYKGGEKAFLHNYLYESVQFKNQFGWFTSLVSRKELLKDLKKSAKKLQIPHSLIIEMNQGNKISHIFAWRF